MEFESPTHTGALACAMEGCSNRTFSSSVTTWLVVTLMGELQEKRLTHCTDQPIPSGVCFRMACLECLIRQTVDQRNILLHRVILRFALLAFPGLELGASHHIDEARLLALHVALGSLFIKGIDLEEGLVVRAGRQGLGFGHRLLEAIGQAAHCFSPEFSLLPHKDSRS